MTTMDYSLSGISFYDLLSFPFNFLGGSIKVWIELA